jgi:hypothetical protein
MVSGDEQRSIPVSEMYSERLHRLQAYVYIRMKECKHDKQKTQSLKDIFCRSSRDGIYEQESDAMSQATSKTYRNAEGTLTN